MQGKALMNEEHKSNLGQLSELINALDFVFWYFLFGLVLFFFFKAAWHYFNYLMNVIFKH